MIRKIICSSIFLGISAFAIAQNKSASKKTTVAPVEEAGHNIAITLTPYKNTWVYLGNYYGKYKNLADSAWLNEKSQGVFKGMNKYPEGIYFLVSPQRYILTEFLMEKDQHFTITGDTSRLNEITITGSAQNQIYQAYTNFLATKVPVITALQEQLGKATTQADSATIKADIAKENALLNQYREKLIKAEPNALLSGFFQAMKRPEIPEAPVLQNGKRDSTYIFRYVKDNWWNDVDFNNESLVRTPFFEPKLEEYFKYYVAPQPDSVISEVNYIMLMARESREMTQYLLGKFTDKYINPEYMGLEKVFLFLFDKFYSKGDTAWLNEKQRKFIFDRAYSLMANQLGEKAADLNMVDTLGNKVTLSGIKSPYTFVTFWDPNCGHCKETIPRIDSMYRAKWKAQGVTLFGVNVDETANDAWKRFVSENKLQGWVHAYQTAAAKQEESRNGLPNYRQLYDVYKTPTMYLLDSEKRIIGKMLSLEQFDEVLQTKIERTSAK